jgi:hypothetical protein
VAETVMSVMFDTAVDPQVEWLYHVGPVGLVIGPNVIRDEDLTPPRQSAVETEAVAELLGDPDGPALTEPWEFFHRIFGWEARYVAGAPGGPELPIDLATRVDEHDVTLVPDWAVRDLGEADPNAFQILVKLHTGLEADKRGVLDGWPASPHQQFERLLHDTGVAIGVLVDRAHLRLVYAPPRGETSGWLSFPLRSLGTVAGRTMLAGLKLMLGHARLFTEPEARRLPKLFARSREAQNKVSAELAEQVLGALHELLRAFHAADPQRIEALAATRPAHLYEGLLTTLMRLVFLLYAEDRELMPSQRTGTAVEVYEQGYSVRGLYARLAEDRALHPDTMDERVGGWGRLLALFRLVHGGHGSWITARGGKLFDPNVFPFLEGRDEGEPMSAGTVLPIRDGAILRILEGLMTIEARSVTGERVRERLSYRSLDVEQIGSVYEIVMGFKVETADGRSLAIRAGKNNRTPVFVDLEALLAQKGKDRIKYLKEEADRGQLSATVGKAVEAAKTVADLAAALDPIVDERASPRKHEAAPGTPILQPTDERRRSGSHYTPRSLTEPIVRHALEPAFERLGPNVTPEQILDLKVCDPAMGSGAFLVEACRAIAARLVKAWERWPEKRPAIPADEDEDLHARRLVAQRCLYGVDKNPLATDLAKLSLWLATLARDHEFTFLDHALKSGDSLVGLTQAQIAAAHWDTSKPGLPLFRKLVKERVAKAMTGRAEIQAAPDDTARAIQEARHRSLEARLKEVRLMGDAAIAAFFAEDKPKAREKKRAEVESLFTADVNPAWAKLKEFAKSLQHGEHQLTPFHWEIEFPEVFARKNGGFDGIVGNPPFAGKNTIIAAHRRHYLPWLQTLHEGAHGNADYVAHFFRRAFALIREHGVFGLIATNTIGQGDTRSTGLAAILSAGGAIKRAVKRLAWPGEAAVVVSVVHIVKGRVRSSILDNRQVSRISAYLVGGEMDGIPEQLAANARKAFIGSYLLGMGFTFDDTAAMNGEAESLATMRALLVTDSRNAERILPYIGGEEVNSSPIHAPHRYVIDFADFPLRREPSLPLWDGMRKEERKAMLREGIVPGDYPEPVAADWPDLLTIVERLVRPQRLKQNDKVGKKLWWRFLRRRNRLYTTIAPLDRIVVCSRIGNAFAFTFLPKGIISNEKTVAIASDRAASLTLLSSRPHETWARFFSSTLKDDLQYTPSDCFENFPFPPEFETDHVLESAGCAYHEHRAALMVARKEGLTKTYNRFHDRSETAEDIQRLRDLHAAMDRALLEAYGWHDLAARAAPVFLDETNEDDRTYQGRLFWPSEFRDEVLARLLALNAERHAEEVRLGIAPGMKGKAQDESEDEVDVG